MKKKVYIIGAGPGDSGLFTLKGKRILEIADVVIYDRLVGKEILSFCKEGAEMIYVGKGSKDSGSLQDSINSILLEKAKEGGIIARLHGGDPFLFGRGGEEADILYWNNIDFEVVPGITSAIAVPAYGGIPVTTRGYSSDFHVYTGKSKTGKIEVDFESAAKLGGTLVFLMGVESLPEICTGLIKHGRLGDTPCALIENGTLPYQRKVVGELGNILEKSSAAGIKPPAVFVVGDVVNLVKEVGWFEKRELYGKKIIITRNEERFFESSGAFEEAGGETISFPVISIEKEEYGAEALIKEIEAYDAVLFNSANGVKCFFDEMESKGIDVRILGKIKIGVIGDGTLRELKKYRIIPDFIPEKFTVEESLKCASENLGAGRRIAVVTSDISPLDEVAAGERYNLEIDKRVLYKTSKIEKDRDDYEKLFEKNGDIITFMSSSAVEAFFQGIKEKGIEFPENLKCASIGPMTSNTLRKFGREPEIEAEKFTGEGLFEAICRFYEKR